MGRARGGRAAASLVVLGIVVGQALAASPPAARAQTGITLKAPCPALGGAFNRWAPLSTPGRLAHVASFGQAPCTFVGTTSDGAVYRTTDARAWSAVVALDDLETVAGVAAEEMPVGTAFVFGTPEDALLGSDGTHPRAAGMYVTRDFGASFRAIPDLAGFSVSAVAAAPSDPQVLYAAASPVRGVPVPLTLKSSDFGRTWIPLPGSLPVRPTRIAVDARLPDVVWANSTVDGTTPSGGVWRSLDGGLTFDRVRDDTVLDFDAAPVPGGGSRVDMATPGGLVRTRDNGTTFRTVTTESVTAVTHERFAPDALMAVVSARAARSVTAGRTFKASPGLGDLAGCAVTDLTRNEEFPSHFLLSLAGCDAAGHYLYRSDGRDLAGIEDLGGDVESSLVPSFERLPRTEMPILRVVDLPITSPVNPSSGSIAFDGEHLYYTNNDTNHQIHVSTTTGDHVRTLSLDEGYNIRTLTYDPHLDKLWAAIHLPIDPSYLSVYMYLVDPRTGAATQMFKSPLDAQTTLSMDPTEGVFRSYAHHGYQVHEISRSGKVVESCMVPGFPVDPNVSTNPDRNHPEMPAPGFATGLAVGGGRMYLQLEDDRTIYHVSKDCELLSVFEHRRFAESSGGGLENDQMACDTVTFGQPAIWIRDADVNAAYAYAVPNGYCPLDSKVTMTPPKVTAKAGDEARACALLLGDGPSDDVIPVPGAELTFFAGDAPVAAAVTDGDGFACASFRAPPAPARSLPLEAAFFGNVSFRPSSGAGLLETFTPMAPDPKAPVPPPPPPEEPQVVVIPPPLPPPPVQAPVPGGPHAPKPPQQPNPQPQQQPQVQAQAGLARQQQQQTQLAFAFSADESPLLNEEYAMSERGDRNLRLSFQGAAALVMLAFGWCMTRTSYAFRKVRR
ncbi:MAG TPA: hypothetical protein VEV43_11500 [Actinomycetota bacterium]|nr:hypothetical protein [Actinomycetota bacterium]